MLLGEVRLNVHECCHHHHPSHPQRESLWTHSLALPVAASAKDWPSSNWGSEPHSQLKTSLQGQRPIACVVAPCCFPHPAMCPNKSSICHSSRPSFEEACLPLAAIAVPMFSCISEWQLMSWKRKRRQGLGLLAVCNRVGEISPCEHQLHPRACVKVSKRACSNFLHPPLSPSYRQRN